MISQVAMVKAVVHASDATAPDRGGVVSQANLRHSNRRPEPITRAFPQCRLQTGAVLHTAAGSVKRETAPRSNWASTRGDAPV